MRATCVRRREPCLRAVDAQAARPRLQRERERACARKTWVSYMACPPAQCPHRHGLNRLALAAAGDVH